MEKKFVAAETAKLYQTSDGSKVLMELLWGDQVTILSDTLINGMLNVRARWATSAFIDPAVLGTEALLELYFIDVGQGDGVLVVTPDRKHVLIDGGYTRDKQPHGKSAADFVDWKFHDEYGMDTIVLDAMICSHCDADHYGGLWDLLNEEKRAELDTKKTEVKNFYHAGVSWWQSDAKDRFLGETANGNLISLLTGKTSITKGLSKTSALRLQGEWAQFLKTVSKANPQVERLSYNPTKPFEYLPGFGTDTVAPIKILGPIETKTGTQAGLKDFGSTSINTNGNSILLRIDYKKSRILLTGDLNAKSQRHIMDSLAGNKQELAADVVKACHHGSDDCSIEFLQYVQAAATVISSGDDENHAHPRPTIVAASGVTGFRKVVNDQIVTPLIYSTEISRSLKIGNPTKVTYTGYYTPNGKIDLSLENKTKVKMHYTHTTSGALNASKKVKSLSQLKIVDGIVYGLVNVRTDGNKILCATLNEGKAKWEIKSFYSRF